MASGETVDDVIRRIINILDAASVPYMLARQLVLAIRVDLLSYSL